MHLGIDCESNSELKLLIWTEEFHKNFNVVNHLKLILNIQISVFLVYINVYVYVCVYVHGLYTFTTEKSLNVAFKISSLLTGKVDPM